MSRPWGRERVAAWWAVAAPDGRPLPGIFLRMDDVDAWIDRHPGVTWRVAFWFRGLVEGRCLVRSRPGKQNRWRTVKRFEPRKGERDGGGIV